MHRYMVWATKLIRSSAEKDFRVLVDKKLIMTQQCNLTEKKTNRVLGCIKKNIASTSRGDPSPLLYTGGATHGVLCPFLVSSVQERHGHIGKSPVKGHEDGERTGASLMRKGQGSWDSSA